MSPHYGTKEEREKRKRRIIELWVEGLNQKQIAVRVGKSAGYVSQILVEESKK